MFQPAVWPATTLAPHHLDPPRPRRWSRSAEPLPIVAESGRAKPTLTLVNVARADPNVLEWLTSPQRGGNRAGNGQHGSIAVPAARRFGQTLACRIAGPSS